MKFLVILICLALNYFWLRDYDRFDDRWFFRFRENIESATRRLAGNAAVWQSALALIYALPLLVLFLVLELAAGHGIGLLTMLVHILVLLVAFDRTQPGKLAREFLAIWSEGDREAAAGFLRTNFHSAREQEFASNEEVAWFFRERLVYRSFERMFVQFFWYLAAGPFGVLVSYVSYQLRDSHDAQSHPRAVETVHMIVHLLEWIPLRLVALSFSLAGNFVHCFAQLRKSFWEFGREVDNAGLLYSFAGFALFGGIPRDESETGTGAVGQDAGQSHQAREIESLQALLERCQLLWLGLLALFTILGPAL